jgi:hypothetical protein
VSGTSFTRRAKWNIKKEKGSEQTGRHSDSCLVSCRGPRVHPTYSTRFCAEMERKGKVRRLEQKQENMVRHLTERLPLIFLSLSLKRGNALFSCAPAMGYWRKVDRQISIGKWSCLYFLSMAGGNVKVGVKNEASTTEEILASLEHSFVLLNENPHL